MPSSVVFDFLLYRFDVPVNQNNRETWLKLFQVYDYQKNNEFAQWIVSFITASLFVSKIVDRTTHQMFRSKWELNNA